MRTRRTLTQICRFTVYLGLLYQQQPFWGVGRLRLSCKGIREPHLDKCNDSRLFCIIQKKSDILCKTRRAPDIYTTEVPMIYKITPQNRASFLKALFIATIAITLNLVACSGVDGKDGIAGADGRDGRDGVAGLNGKDGIDGKDGTPGANGKDGVDGKDAVVNVDSLAEAIKKELMNSLKDSQNVKFSSDSGNSPQSVIRSLYAEEVDILAKTNVYGAFANQYSLLYDEFYYLGENVDTATIPMPFPIAIANICDSTISFCYHKKIMLKSWIQDFTDTVTITQVIDSDTVIFLSPMFVFDDRALFALTAPKKAQRHIEVYALESDQKFLFYSATKQVTIHPMQNFGAKEEAFTIGLYPDILKPYWYSVFVTPTADSISTIVSEVAKKLPEGKLLVYQKYDDDTSIEQSLQRVVKAVFEVLQSRGIKYIQNTGSATIGQRINYPVETLRKKEGICIETAVLFASILERLGFDTRIIITENHAFTGWATEDGGNIIDLVETTFIADKSTTFADANEKGIDEFNQEKSQGNFESGKSTIVLINLARAYGINPNNIP